MFPSWHESPGSLSCRSSVYEKACNAPLISFCPPPSTLITLPHERNVHSFNHALSHESLKLFPHTTHCLDVYCSHRQHVLHLAMCTQHKSRKRSVYTIRMPHKRCHSPWSLANHRQCHNPQPPTRHESLARPAPSPARGRYRDAVAVWLRLHPRFAESLAFLLPSRSTLYGRMSVPGSRSVMVR